MRRAVFVLLLALLPAIVVGPAAAHPVVGAPSVEIAQVELVESISAAPARVTLPWLAMGLAGLAALALRRRPRHALALVLVVLCVVLAFETGVHSAHHFGDHSTSCAVASVSGQLSGTIGGTLVDTAPITRTVASLALPDVVACASGVLSPDAGRAPPLQSA